MNSRILEIIKNPDLLVSDDIEILEKEISQHPFAQSFRALQLLATHRFNEKLYPEKLSETAAFTTDKKILYHLIHQKEIEKNEVLVEKEIVQSNNINDLNSDIEEEKNSVSKVEKLISTPAEKFQEVELIPIDSPKPVFIEGKLNRILFEGEENFLNEENESVDLEASQESGTLVIASKDEVSGEFSSQNPESNQSENLEEVVDEDDRLNDSQNAALEIPKEDSEEATREFTTETIIDEDEIASEEEVLEQFSQLSFHGIDADLQPENTLVNDLQDSKPDNSETFPEEATRKFSTETIIDEENIKSEDEIIESGSELSFHGETEFLSNVKIEVKNDSTPHFVAENKTSKHELEMQKLIAEVNAKMKKATSKVVEPDDDIQDSNFLDFTGISHEEKPFETKEIDKPEVIEAQENETPSTWKPMGFGTQTTRFRDSTEENVDNEINSKKEDFQEKETADFSLKKEENKKAFTEDLSTKNIDNQEVSNVPTFIDTWQSWLKLGSENKPKTEDVKQKAIETFIEKAPKISKLKEESNFTVKDKGDNISHLMTETLANLYLDQKLYSKAQKAFELLIEKEPQKADKFVEKLAEIKELRSQK